MTNEAKGATCGLAAAALFGMSAPMAKSLLGSTGPLVLSALLYLGGGTGLVLFGVLAHFRPRQQRREAAPKREDIWLLVGVILCGGVLGPLLMLWGLARVSGVAGSLLLNLEGPFTVIIALLLFREHLGRQGGAGALLVLSGAVAVGWRGGDEVHADWLGALSIAGACASWAVDNNLTQRLSVRDPIATVRIKALGAGACMLMAAVALGHPFPAATTVVTATGLGAVSYGVSIVLDMYALRLVGAAREAAYFATAPFIGAVVAVPLLGERLTTTDIVGASIMAAGIALLIRARHVHVHTHELMDHDHVHEHDEHHQHEHAGAAVEPHSHPHRHVELTHDHPHVSDVHHRHGH